MERNTAYRDCSIGELGLKDKDRELTLCGWVETIRDHGGVLFFHLRDSFGRIQALADPEILDEINWKAANEVHIEYCLQLKGFVRERPEGKDRTMLESKDVEFEIQKLEILSSSAPVPFRPEDHSRVGEEQRLYHRYLDLRSDEMQQSLKLRSDFLLGVRNELATQGFTEVETPQLARSTPEGARDFLVPSRVHAGQFYALPQSPQLFKQLLMIGGFDRYYQVARCFRDEDQRTNRQPEFTQLDLEMSFVHEEDVMKLVEHCLNSALKTCGYKSIPEFQRLNYQTSMNLYGSENPDLRFDLPVHDLTPIFENTPFQVFKRIIDQGGLVRAIVIPARYEASRSDIEWLREEVGRMGVAEPAWGHLRSGTFESTIAKFFSADEVREVAKTLNGGENDLVLFMAGPTTAHFKKIIGELRLRIRDRFKLIEGKEKELHFAWITDFPLFEWDPSQKSVSPMHHPFTMPGDAEALFNAASKEDFLTLGSRAYDLVLNGQELGSGSIRIHDLNLQLKILDLLGIDEKLARERFGFLLRGLEYGAPPHGGIALGVDRLISLLLGTESIRDTIAFPKNKHSFCPMTQAPSEVDLRQLQEIHIRTAGKTP